MKIFEPLPSSDPNPCPIANFTLLFHAGSFFPFYNVDPRSVYTIVTELCETPLEKKLCLEILEIVFYIFSILASFPSEIFFYHQFYVYLRNVNYSPRNTELNRNYTELRETPSKRKHVRRCLKSRSIFSVFSLGPI